MFSKSPETGSSPQGNILPVQLKAWGRGMAEARRCGSQRGSPVEGLGGGQHGSQQLGLAEGGATQGVVGQRREAWLATMVARGQDDRGRRRRRVRPTLVRTSALW